MNNNCLNYTGKHGGDHLTIWVFSFDILAFGEGKVGSLVKITSKMKQNSYHSILVHDTVPSGIRNIGQGFIFQQDNDPNHV